MCYTQAEYTLLQEKTSQNTAIPISGCSLVSLITTVILLCYSVSQLLSSAGTMLGLGVEK